MLHRAEAKIDYFATSLPTMLLFEDDLRKRQQITALFLMARASLGLERKREAGVLLQKILRRDGSHAQAADLMESLLKTELIGNGLWSAGEPAGRSGVKTHWASGAIAPANSSLSASDWRYNLK
jgi:hypothetical protein